MLKQRAEHKLSALAARIYQIWTKFGFKCQMNVKQVKIYHSVRTEKGYEVEKSGRQPPRKQKKGAAEAAPFSQNRNLLVCAANSLI